MIDDQLLLKLLVGKYDFFYQLYVLERGTDTRWEFTR